MFFLPLSFPRMKINTDCSPKRLRKYHDRLDTHRTSRSRVATPDCSMDLKRIVRGNGNFTMQPSLSACYSHTAPGEVNIWHTNNKTSKESINPPHDQRLWYHHSHVSLHHTHHALHSCWVRHRVPSWLASVVRIFKKYPIFVRGDKIVLPGSECTGRNGGAIRAQVHATKEGALFAEDRGFLFFGCSSQKNCCVVAEDTGENLKHCQKCSDKHEWRSQCTMTTEIGKRIQ